MSEYLRYNISDNGALQLDVPREIFTAAISESRIGEILSHPLELVTHQDSPVDRLTFNLAPFRAVVEFDNDVSEAYASQWLHTLVNIERATPEEARDPDMYVLMGTNPLSDSSQQQRRGMYARFAWPFADTQAAAHAAVGVMREHATSFGYLKPSIADAAYSIIDEHGAEFQALDAGCCCLGSNGERVEAEDTTIELYGHNLYNRQLVLTCLSGLVAAVRT